MMHVHGVVFSATGQRGNGLPRIQEAFLIKTTAYPEKLLPFIVGELNTHLADLLDSNPVFSGYGSAHFNTKLQYLAAKFFGFFELPWIVCVVKNQRVKVSVTGVKNICHR